MNYRHAFHAGNFADVLKHTVLTLALERLREKDRPLLVLDTHAGAGRYDLGEARAGRTGEAASGIRRLLARKAHPDPLRRYLEIVRGFDRRLGGDGRNVRHYPGSPRIVRALMRPMDRLIACEMQSDEGLALRREFAGDRQVEVRRSDGYAALKAVLPPPERRALVLIDPPFEARDEFERLQRALKQAFRRFATGTYLIWYPVKTATAVAGLKAFLSGAGLHRALWAELQVVAEREAGLARAGGVLVNAPWPIEDSLAEIGPFLADALGGKDGRFETDWLAKD